MSVLTVYPSYDGYSYNWTTNPWLTKIAANGSYYVGDGTSLKMQDDSTTTTTDEWQITLRAFIQFDTSSLGSGASISAAVLSIYRRLLTDTDGMSPTTGWYSATITEAKSDYESVGSTLLSSTLNFDDWGATGYSAFTLNASGRTYINQTGNTDLGSRETVYDAGATKPPWVSDTEVRVIGYGTAETGTTKDPKLVITYTSGATDVTVEPAVLVTTLSQPAPTISATQFITVEPSVLELTLSQPAPTVVISGEAVDVTVEPTVLGITLSQPVPTVTGGADITTEPSVLELTLSQPDPTVTATENVTIELTVLGITLSQPAPTVVTTESVTTTPAVLATSLIINAPTVTGTEGVIITPSVLETNLILNAPTVITEVNTTVTPNVLETVLTTNAPTVIATRSVTAKPGVASLTLSVNAPLVIAAKLITLPAITSTNHGQEYVIKDTAFTFDNDNVKLITTGSDTLNKGIEMCLPKEGTSIVVVANNNVKDWEIKSLYYAGLVDILIKSTTRITTTYTILVTDDRIFADTDGGAFTVTLPAGVEGQEFRIINCGSSGNDLTIAPNGAENLTGANASKAASDGTVVILTYNATEGWW